MNTKSKKLNELFQDLTILSDDLARIRKELDALRRQDISPTKPEPLECWVNYATNGEILEAHKTLFDAQSSRGTMSIHMRQVTPQDERDRKDAVRYRYYKSMPYRFAGADYVDFDAEIDKAMEGGDAE